MIRSFISICLLFGIVAGLGSCDLRSGTAKEEMEKFSGSPTPTFAPPSPEPTPDPADAIAVDVSVEGGTITVLGYKEKKTAVCSKFDRVMINGDDNIVTIKGGCSQIVANGDRNQITADAAMEFVLNGKVLEICKRPASDHHRTDRRKYDRKDLGPDRKEIRSQR